MKTGRKLHGLCAESYLCLTGVYDKIPCTGSHPLAAVSHCLRAQEGTIVDLDQQQTSYQVSFSFQNFCYEDFQPN